MAGLAHVPIIVGVEGLQLVGQGGFASVYRGHQAAFRRDVAVKVLQRSGLDEDDRRRFDRECQAMGALSSHPGIVTLFDAGFTDDKHPYLVMEYVADGTLHDRLANAGPMDWQEVTALGVRLCGALETAHRAGVLHRDIKPANVLRSEYGEQLSDFGIARIQGGHETRSGVITASVAHAAPEILDGDPPSAEADVYGLASTLYEALTGRAAFVREADEGLLPLIRRVVSEPPPDLRPRGIPDPVATVIETAMAKDPTGRYPTAETFGLALRGAQAVTGIGVTDLAVVGGAGEAANGSSLGPVGPTAGAATAGIAAGASGSSSSPPAALAPSVPRSDETADLSSREPVELAATTVTDGSVGAAGGPAAGMPPGGTRLPPGEAPNGSGDDSGGTKKAALIAGVLAAVVALVIGLVVVTSGDDQSPGSADIADPADTTVENTAGEEVVPETLPEVSVAPSESAVPEPTVPPEDGGATSDVEIGVVAVLADDSHPFFAGLDRAAEDFGVEIARSSASVDLGVGMSDLISSGQNPIIALAHAPIRDDVVAAVESSAAAHPDVTFILIDAEVDARNVVSMTFAEEEGSFLMGVIAALTTAVNRVGFIGGADTESVRRYEAGFVAGVRQISPTVAIEVNYLPGTGKSYDDHAAAFDEASVMYENGADVIYHAGTAGGGLFDASRVAGRWAIGVDVDQALTADPEVAGAILTSMVKRYDEVAYLAVADAVNAEMTPGSEVFGVAEGDVVWSETGGHIASIVADVEMWRDAIGTGAVTVPSVVERRALVPRGTACPAEGCIIRFITVEPSGSELQVTLEANWVLDVGAMHAHYYWSPRYTSSQVGGDSEARFGVPVGDWDLDDSYPVYVTQGSVSLAGRGDDSELCVTPADAGHNVIDPNLFDCILIGDLVG